MNDDVIGELGVYWDHRVISDGETIWIGEVYYDDDDQITGFTGSGSNLLSMSCFNEVDEGVNEAELKSDFDMMATAFTKPTLEIPPCFQPPDTDTDTGIRQVFPWEER